MKQLNTIFYLFILFFTLIFSPNSSIAQRYADCIKAKSICSKGTYQFEKLGGEGNNNREALGTPCFESSDKKGNGELNSAWIRFEIAKSGTLKFTIRPKQFDDDIDFVVYRLKGENCESRQIVRCMAAGDRKFPSLCMGATGLKDGNADVSEEPGCQHNSNSWLAPIKAKEGETYVILVSNVTSEGPGFSFYLHGTCMLPCEEEKPKEKPKEPVVSAPIASVSPPKKEKEKPSPKIEKVEEIEPITRVETTPIIAEKILLPSVIEGRKTSVGKVMTVKNEEVTLKVWDNSIEDGDIISIYLNGNKLYSNIALTTKPQTFLLKLEKGENFITAHAVSFGKREPNTAAITIYDGKKEQKISLTATKQSEESLKIIVE